jgi:hypothetical protein
VVLEGDLHSNQVTLPRRGILYDLELDILVVECLIASFGVKRCLKIIIVISVVDIILRLSLLVVGVVGIIP